MVTNMLMDMIMDMVLDIMERLDMSERLALISGMIEGIGYKNGLIGI